MRKRSSTIILVLIFFLGLGIMLYPIVANWWNSKVQSKVIYNYESVIKKIDQKDYSRYFDAAEEYNKKLQDTNYPIVDYKTVPGYETTLDIDGTGVMGYINIEKLKVEIPIYHGTSDSALSAGVGHMEGTSLPVGGPGTHCALSAHRGLPSSKLFSDLDEMEVGDLFTITVLDRLLTYQVDQIKIVLPHELDDLAIEEGKDYCTLVTCTPYGINTHRLLVRGHRVENEAVKPQIYVPNEAIKVDPLVVAPIVAIPLVILTMIGVAVKYRKK